MSEDEKKKYYKSIESDFSKRILEKYAENRNRDEYKKYSLSMKKKGLKVHAYYYFRISLLLKRVKRYLLRIVKRLFNNDKYY